MTCPAISTCRRRRRRASPTRSSTTGVRAPGRRPAVPTPTRSSPTTSPTPPPRSRRPGRCSTTAPRATSRAASTCAFVADAVADLVSRSCSAARRSGASSPAPLDGARDVRRHLPRSGVPRRRWPTTPAPATSTTTSRWCRTPSAASPTTRSRPVAEHVHRDNADIPEDIIAGLGRDRRLRAVGPGGVRRLRRGRRERLPRHGRRHRGAVARRRSASAAR